MNNPLTLTLTLTEKQQQGAQYALAKHVFTGDTVEAVLTAEVLDFCDKKADEQIADAKSSAVDAATAFVGNADPQLAAAVVTVMENNPNLTPDAAKQSEALFAQIVAIHTDPKNIVVPPPDPGV